MNNIWPVTVLLVVLTALAIGTALTAKVLVLPVADRSCNPPYALIGCR